MGKLVCPWLLRGRHGQAAACPCHSQIQVWRHTIGPPGTRL